MKHSQVNCISGQLFFRNAGPRFYKDRYELDEHQKPSAPDGSGRDLVMVVGIIALPQGHPIQGECQYVVIGNNEHDTTRLSVMNNHFIDRTEMAKGQSLGGLITSPIWRF